MKLSFSTLGCPAWSLEEILDAAGRLGYDGVELRFIEGDDALWARPELTGTGLQQTRSRLLDAGLAISCVDTRSFFHDPDANVRERAFEEAVRALELAAHLGAPGIRVFGDRVQPGQDLGSTRRFIAEALERLGERARPLGVEVWIESHGDFARARDTLAILDLVKSKAVGVLWDPANAFECGEAAEAGLRALRGRIRHVHLKDLKRETPAGGASRSVPALPGHGDFAPDTVLLALKGSSYQGWVSFEWEKRWYPAIEGPEVALPHFIRWAAPQMRSGAPEVFEPGRPARVLDRGRLTVEVHADRLALGRAAAARVAAQLRGLVARDGGAAAIFASAPSQNEFLAALRQEPELPWEKITAFHLDEYIGLSARHPASFRRFLLERLFEHVPVRAFHGLNGEAPDAAAECARYTELLRRERPGLAVLGIGENGHLAFIDPPVCDFGEPLDVRVVELDETCRLQQVHDGAFARVEDVPKTALSLSIPFLMRVPRAVAIVPGTAKRAAVAAALEGPVTRACPASILRRHPHATLLLEVDSASWLAAAC